MTGRTNISIPDFSDNCTAIKDMVLAGYTAITKDSNNEIITGSMPNRGMVSQLLNAGGSYTIPQGYHNGSGKVTANNLVNQTSATATAEYLYSGKTAWVNGNKITGNMMVGNVLNFSAQTYSGRQILLKWQNPYAATGRPYGGVFINYSTAGYPGTGGTRIYTGIGNNTVSGGWSQVIVTLPNLNTTYYFSCTPYCSCSAGEMWGSTLNASGSTQADQTFNLGNSTSFIVPSGYSRMHIFLVGGGGGGINKNNTSTGPGGGGGGGGYTTTLWNIAVSGGETVSVVIGAGGAGSTNGGNSSVSINNYQVALATGGSSLRAGSYTGANGGSGGAAGGAANGEFPGGNGGSNGGNGSTGNSLWTPGTGQVHSTYPFGNPAYGSLYSGGGGGGAGALSPSSHSNPGSGGNGGGGAGGSTNTDGASGSVNTGGGGGGGGASVTSRNKGGVGGWGGSGFAIIKIE